MPPSPSYRVRAPKSRRKSPMRAGACWPRSACRTAANSRSTSPGTPPRFFLDGRKGRAAEGRPARPGPMRPAAEGAVAAARRLADDVLFPDAMHVDRLDVLPTAHLDALAAAGLFGAPAPVEVGGLGLDLRELSAVVEEVAGGCLTTAFVWIQHLRLLMKLG